MTFPGGADDVLQSVVDIVTFVTVSVAVYDCYVQTIYLSAVYNSHCMSLYSSPYISA